MIDLAISCTQVAYPEVRSLEELEAVIEGGFKAWVKASVALEEIRDRRLYRQCGYGRFEDYCQDRWNIAKTQAYRFIAAADVARILSPMGDIPANERQARELVPLLKQDETAACDVWRALLEDQGKGITAKQVREAVEARLSPPPHVSFNGGNNEWYTPAEYITAARRVMGEIDLDPASSAAANKIVKALCYHTAEDDGLRYPWAGRVWLNPPYAVELIGRFAEKLVRHFEDGEVSEAIVLVNNATETRWFQRLLMAASAVCFPMQRVRFLDANGAPGAPLQGQAVLYLGKRRNGFDREFEGFGTILYGQ